MLVGFERVVEPGSASAQFGKAVKQKRIFRIDHKGALHQLDRSRCVSSIIGDEGSKVKRGRVVGPDLEYLATYLVGLRKAASLAMPFGRREDLR